MGKFERNKRKKMDRNFGVLQYLRSIRSNICSRSPKEKHKKGGENNVPKAC